MLARVIRFYGGMPEDWLSAPLFHFLAMWNQINAIERQETQTMWRGMAIAFHKPSDLDKLTPPSAGADDESDHREIDDLNLGDASDMEKKYPDRRKLFMLMTGKT
jgi:hypothetical protein